jgi:beta-N-acetylhexosaminidase
MTERLVMIDIEGASLSAEDRELLDHPAVGGLILFTRNFASRAQVVSLVQAIRRAARNKILIAVDHEGGRVQRFRHEFTKLPAVRGLGHCYDQQPQQALQYSRDLGWLMAAELRAVDIDISFAPVLDLDWGASAIIGDRAFHQAPEAIVALVRAYIQGMHEAGMAATGKHFPGHGGVAADSHLELPIDDRPREEIWAKDLVPFRMLAAELDAVMPAHVVYRQIDQQPAGFSKIWLQQVLRRDLAFGGVIFSDDLSMEGAAFAGSFEDRTLTALEAGCDMVLVCNHRKAAIEVVDAARRFRGQTVDVRALCGKQASAQDARETQPERWQAAVALANRLQAP